MLQTNKLEERLGRCYEYAFKTLEKFPQFKLIHSVGKQTKTRELMGHAWLELNDFVYDAVMDKFVKKELYYKIFEIELRIEYTLKEARELISKHQHYGFWDERMMLGYPNGFEIFEEK